jgi:hypothetical protein
MKELAGILAAQISMLTKIIEIGPKEHYKISWIFIITPLGGRKAVSTLM